jgi:acyl dehydratase
MSTEERTGKTFSVSDIDDFVGTTIGSSDWFEITQADTNAFAHATHDPDRNHIDPDWARERSPFGVPVAFGFQTLSLLTHLGKMAGIVPAGICEEYNYGLNRVRFPNPVKIGTRIRCILSLKSYRRRPDGCIILTFEPVIEIEGEDKPALVAEWLVMVRPANASA